MSFNDTIINTTLPINDEEKESFLVYLHNNYIDLYKNCSLSENKGSSLYFVGTAIEFFKIGKVYEYWHSNMQSTQRSFYEEHSKDNSKKHHIKNPKEDNMIVAMQFLLELRRIDKTKSLTILKCLINLIENV